MNCDEIQKLMHGYIDGELDLVRNLEIERHLETCPSCRQTYRNLQALRTAARSPEFYYNAPASLEKRVLDSVRRAERANTAPRVPPWRWLTLAASFAAVLILVAWSLVRLARVPTAEDLLRREVLADHVRSLMVDHVSDVASTDQHTVKPWFNGKLDYSPPVTDLAAQGFPLTGGRLDYLDNRPVAALVYHRNKHIINLFVWPSTSSADSPPAPMMQSGYHLWHWTQGGMNYWAISDLNNAEMKIFVSLVQHPPS